MEKQLHSKDFVLANCSLEDTNAVIVGRYMQKGVLMYQDRQQGSKYAETDDELNEWAESLKSELINDFKDTGVYQKDGWELRIY